MSRSGSQVPARRGAYPGRVPDMRGWLRRHPWQADGLLALLLAALSSGQWQGANAHGIAAVSVLLAATVVARRRYPVAAFAVAAAIGAAQVTIGVQPAGEAVSLPGTGLQLSAILQPTAADLAIAGAAVHPGRPPAAAGLRHRPGALPARLRRGGSLRWAPAHATHPGAQLFAAAAGLGGAGTDRLGARRLMVAYRYRRAYYASLEERAARLEAERDAQARIAQAAERARELQERRARVVDESAARLRRIERDLHDGAQVRLAALAMTLGEIKENLDTAAGRRRR